MSRRIDESRPYTDEEKAYLLARSGGASKVRINEKYFAHLAEEDKKREQELSAKDEEEFQADIKAQEPDVDDYHDEDLHEVESLNTRELRLRLKKEGLKAEVSARELHEADGLTERQILAYRLLDLLDERRNGPAPE